MKKEIAPTFAQPADQTATRPINLEDQHRAADVDSKLARLFVVQCGFGVVTQDVSRRGYFNPTYPGKATQLFDDSGANVRCVAWSRDFGIVIEENRNLAV